MATAGKQGGKRVSWRLFGVEEREGGQLLLVELQRAMLSLLDALPLPLAPLLRVHRGRESQAAATSGWGSLEARDSELGREWTRGVAFLGTAVFPTPA